MSNITPEMTKYMKAEARVVSVALAEVICRTDEEFHEFVEQLFFTPDELEEGRVLSDVSMKPIGVRDDLIQIEVMGVVVNCNGQ